MSYVFISFGPADRGYAAQLADYLRASGVPVWLDEYPDLPGRWEQVGRDAIDGCAAFVVVMSPDSADAPNVTREIDHAFAVGRPVVPLLLLGQPFPALHGVPAIDVSDGRMPAPERVAALRGLIGTTPPPSSPFPAPSSPFLAPSSPFPAPWSPFPGPASPLTPPPSSPYPAPFSPYAPTSIQPPYPTGLGYPAAGGAGPYVPGAAPVSLAPAPATGIGPIRPSRPGPGFWVVVAAGSAALVLVVVCAAFALPRYLGGPQRLGPAVASSVPSTAAPLPPVPAGATLQVGVDLPWQGSLGRSSQETFDAMQLYLTQVGHKAGPYQIELVKYDDSVASKGTWDEATCTANAAKHLANDREVAIVGTANSGCTKLELRALNTQATPARPTMLMVSHANTSPGLTRPYETGEPQYYYPQGVRNFARVVTTDDQQGDIDAGYAASIGATRCFVLDDTGVYGRSIAAAFVTAAPGRGVMVVGQDHWLKAASTYADLFSRAKAAGANCVFLAGDYVNNGAQLVKDKVAVLGPNSGAVRTIAVEGFVGYPELDSLPAAEGMYLTFPGLTLSAITRQPVGRAFVKDYTSAKGTAPVSAYSLYGVQALQVVLAAIERSNGTRESVRSAVFSGAGITIGAEKAMLGSAVTISPQSGDCSPRQVTVEVIRGRAESFSAAVSAP
jgi:branched-chain amino acid transport system substrate-binding protein